MKTTNNKRQVSFKVTGNMSLIQALEDKGVNLQVDYAANQACASFDSIEHPLYQKLQMVLDNQKTCQMA